MKRLTSRGTTRRGGIQPRHLVLSSRLGAPLQRDGLGRVVVREERVHPCGETAQRLDYDSFGRVLCDTNPGFQPFGFQGGLYDPDTGLVEFGCRWYDAETGRWISKDPIGLCGGLNLYEFCGSNPICFCDPDGCLSWSQVGCFAKALSGGAAAVASSCGGSVLINRDTRKLGPIILGK